MEKAKAGRPPKNPSDDTTDLRGAPTLTELGISRDQSSRWQQVAEVPVHRDAIWTPVSVDEVRISLLKT